MSQFSASGLTPSDGQTLRRLAKGQQRFLTKAVIVFLVVDLRPSVVLLFYVFQSEHKLASPGIDDGEAPKRR